MRLPATSIALTLCLVGCAFGQVELLTGTDAHACYAGGEGHFEGPLVADGDYGTTFNGKPVMWPVGWTGRRVGFEVEVLDDAGKVRAITGKRYNFDIGPISNSDNLARLKSLGAAAVSACGPTEVN